MTPCHQKKLSRKVVEKQLQKGENKLLQVGFHNIGTLCIPSLLNIGQSKEVRAELPKLDSIQLCEWLFSEAVKSFIRDQL